MYFAPSAIASLIDLAETLVRRGTGRQAELLPVHGELGLGRRVVDGVQQWPLSGRRQSVRALRARGAVPGWCRTPLCGAASVVLQGTFQVLSRHNGVETFVVQDS